MACLAASGGEKSERGGGDLICDEVGGGLNPTLQFDIFAAAEDVDTVVANVDTERILWPL